MKGHHEPLHVVWVRQLLVGSLLSTRGVGLRERPPRPGVKGSALSALSDSLAPRSCRHVQVSPKSPFLQFPSPPHVFPNTY